MSRLSKGPRKRRKPTKRLDPASLRELVADGLVWTRIGKVVGADDGGPHYEMVMNGSTLVDILIEFELQSGDGDLVTARYSTLAGSGRGIFILPAVGDEFILLFSDGQLSEALAGMALSSASLPGAAAAATTTNVILCGQQVILTSTAGGGEVPAARQGDSVQVTIPIGVVMIPGSPSPVPNPAPIPLDGTITSGSSVVRIK